MKIVIFDDDTKYLCKLTGLFYETIEKLNLSNFQIALSTPYAEDVVSYLINSKSNSLYVLDIISENRPIGFDMCELIKAKNPKNHVIFITNYPSRILYNSKLKLAALNIILKKSQNFNSEIDCVLKYINDYLEDDFFCVKNKSLGILKICYDEIYYFEKLKNSHNVCVFHKNGHTVFTSSLKELSLNNDFLRVHSSFIVNIKKVIKMDINERLLVLEDNITCPYTKKYRKEIEQCLT